MPTDADLYALELAQVRQQLDTTHAALDKLDALLDEAKNHTDGIQR